MRPPRRGVTNRLLMRRGRQRLLRRPVLARKARPVDDPFRSSSGAHPASASATRELPARRPADERSTMKANVAIEVRRCPSCTSSSKTPCRWRDARSPIENQRPSSPRSRVQALIRSVRQGRRLRPLAGRTRVPRRLRRGYSRRKTARPGPSPAGEWMLSGSEDSLTQLGELLGSGSDATTPRHAPLSTRTATPAYSASLTASSPPLHLRPQPKHRTSTAEVDNRAGHFLVTRLVLADGVAVGETEDLRHIAGINQLVDDDFARHRDKAYTRQRLILTPVSDSVRAVG